MKRLWFGRKIAQDSEYNRSEPVMQTLEPDMALTTYTLT